MSENIRENVPAGHAVVSRDNSKLAVWLFLGGEVIFFTTLILTFVFFRIISPSGYTAFKLHLSIPIIAANTFILITSSYLVVRALEGIHDDNQTKFSRNLIGVIILGALFLGGQAFEWATLFNDGVSITDQFGTPFFTITGIHGTHVFVGLVWAGVLWFLSRRKRFSTKYSMSMELFGLYWHFVDIVWIALFTIFYLI